MAIFFSIAPVALVKVPRAKSGGFEAQLGCFMVSSSGLEKTGPSFFREKKVFSLLKKKSCCIFNMVKMSDIKFLDL